MYASHTQHEFGDYADGAWGGGGGDDRNIRRDFADNPAFVTVETDENGKAEIKFTLADSLTTWRITLHAVTKDNYVGKTKEFIAAQLPFHTNTVMANEFIEGDDITAYIRCFGTEYSLSDKKNVEYAAEIKRGGDIIASDTALAEGSRHFNFGKMPEGEYTIKVVAKHGKHSDGLELPFRVTKSGVRLNLSAYEELNEDNPVLGEYDITAWPVRLSLWNADMQVIYKILNDSTYAGTNRTDRYAASIYAKYYMDRLFSPGSQTGENQYINEFADYAKKTGIFLGYGIPELVYGDYDIGYSSRFAACYPEFFKGNKNIERYFAQNVYAIEKYENGFAERFDPVPEYYDWLYRSCSYLGLAALGKPVLNDIYRDLAIYGYMECIPLLYCAAALCVLGDDTGAWELMNNLNLLSMDKMATVSSDIELAETLMLFVNTTIDPKAALEYAKSYEKNTYVSNSLELIHFVKNYIPASEGVHSSVGYVRSGKGEQRELTNHDFAHFALSREMFEEFDLTHIQGNTGVHISYLPSGMRFQSKEVLNGSTKNATLSPDYYSVSNKEKQFVDINFGAHRNTTVKVSYYATITGAGEYMFEPAYIIAGYGGFDVDCIWGSTERVTVKTAE